MARTGAISVPEANTLASARSASSPFVLITTHHFPWGDILSPCAFRRIGPILQMGGGAYSLGGAPRSRSLSPWLPVTNGLGTGLGPTGSIRHAPGPSFLLGLLRGCQPRDFGSNFATMRKGLPANGANAEEGGAKRWEG